MLSPQWSGQASAYFSTSHFFAIATRLVKILTAVRDFSDAELYCCCRWIFTDFQRINISFIFILPKGAWGKNPSRV